jgi:predicted unusual protein kinase regulating ubiquinone biosynthesis (AarF/ABC1/UbiB family)
MLLDLSGMYVKSAQILASKGDFMPEAWVRRLAAMFDSMPPKPWPATRRVRSPSHMRDACSGAAHGPAAQPS